MINDLEWPWQRRMRNSFAIAGVLVKVWIVPCYCYCKATDSRTYAGRSYVSQQRLRPCGRLDYVRSVSGVSFPYVVFCHIFRTRKWDAEPQCQMLNNLLNLLDAHAWLRPWLTYLLESEQKAVRWIFDCWLIVWCLQCLKRRSFIRAFYCKRPHTTLDRALQTAILNYWQTISNVLY